MFKVKIVVVGPTRSGKTVLCNFLADATESSSGEYQPTQGVRIVEFESGNLNVARRTTKVDIELWDSSGDQKFESCWSAIANDSNGIIFVYNPERVDQANELEKYYSYFVRQKGLKDSQCLIFSHNKLGGSRRPVSKPPPSMSNVQIIPTNLEDDGESLRTGFSIYLKQLLQIMSETRKEEEETIVGN